VGYTVSPQYSEAILERVATRLDYWAAELDTPILVENGPVYFDVPGSTMCQAEFISRLCERRPETRLLVDLAHLCCTAKNIGESPFTLLGSLPLDKVWEVHLSGTHHDGESEWDDHSRPIDDLTFQLLDRLLEQARPRAITIEYNWDPSFSLEYVEADLLHVRGSIGRGI
jgi:uncharacterized protein